MLKKFLNLTVLLLVMGLILSMNNPAMSQEKLTAYVSFYPLYDTADRIGDSQIDLNLVIPNGAEVHSYKPSPRKIAQLEKADIFFYNGAGLEPWTDKAVQNLKESGVKTVNVSKNVDLLPHKHGHYDPHIWLDPVNMKKIGSLITKEFSKLDPNHKEIYQKNFTQFAQKIDRLHREYKTALANAQQKHILVSHSAFGYLANRYGLKQLSVMGVAPHEKPSPGTIAHLTKKTRRYNLDYIFMETLASPKTVNILAQEANLEVLTLNPIAGLTENEKENNEDYFSLMRKNLASLKKAVTD